MKIRKQLAVSYLIIFIIFALNLLGLFVSNYQRNKLVETLQNSISRQVIISSVKLELNDLIKQFALLSEVFDENSEGEENASELNKLKGQLNSISLKLSSLKMLYDEQIALEINTFLKTYQDLKGSWLKVFKNLSVDYSEALTELNAISNPLSIKLMQQLFPKLEKNEKSRLEQAQTDYEETNKLIHELIICLFFVSLFLSVIVALRFSNNLNNKLVKLKEGADLIGKGELEHKININSNDELGLLAKAFNKMGDNILFFINQQKNRQEEIEKAKQEAKDEANFHR